jgi:hypothetical protein
MICLPYYAYVFSSSKLVIRAENDLPGSEGGRGERGERGGRRNDANNVCTCEYMNNLKNLIFLCDKIPEVIKNSRNIPQNMRAIYHKSIATIVLNGEKLKPFSPNQKQKKAVHTLCSYLI